MASRPSKGRALGPGIRWAIVAGELKRVPVGREEGKLVFLTVVILSFKNKKGSRALEEKILTNASTCLHLLDEKYCIKIMGTSGAQYTNYFFEFYPFYHSIYDEFVF